MRYWTEAEKVCFVVTLTLSGAGVVLVGMFAVFAMMMTS